MWGKLAGGVESVLTHIRQDSAGERIFFFFFFVFFGRENLLKGILECLQNCLPHLFFFLFSLVNILDSIHWFSNIKPIFCLGDKLPCWSWCIIIFTYCIQFINILSIHEEYWPGGGFFVMGLVSISWYCWSHKMAEKCCLLYFLKALV